MTLQHQILIHLSSVAAAAGPAINYTGFTSHKSEYLQSTLTTPIYDLCLQSQAMMIMMIKLNN